MTKAKLAKTNIYEVENEILFMYEDEMKNDRRLPGSRLLVEMGQYYIVDENNEYVVVSDPEEANRPDVGFVWNLLDNVLHFIFHHNELDKAVLPFVVLRRIDCCLKPVNEKVRDTYKNFKDKMSEDKLDKVLLNATKQVGKKPLAFYNTSNFSLEELLHDSTNIDLNFRNYMNGFNREVKDIFENFQFDATLGRIIKNGLLYNMVQEICAIKSITPEESDDIAMGYIFEEIIRLASEANNESAGEHFTPRDAIRLMSVLLFDPVEADLNRNGIIRSIYDPTCGTGGMVNVGKRYILEELCKEGNRPTIDTYGQELNGESYAIAKGEAMITGVNADNIMLGNTLTNDHFAAKKFHFIMANPPYGVTWKKDQLFVINESLNPDGRFSAGMPRTSDGQLLFVQHMLSKMMPSGSRVGVVTSGSPLFTGGAGSGESNIRKWMIENDWVEAIIALPKDLFYNTGIGTYIWIFCNSKEERRKGKIQLINAVDYFSPAKKSLGNKRNDIKTMDILKVRQLYMQFKETDNCKIIENKDFGYLEITVEQPKRNANGELELKKGKKIADTSLRSTERLPLSRNAMEYFEEEIKPHVDQDAWIDIPKTKIGYEINFQQYFYKYEKLESAEDLGKQIRESKDDIINLINAIFA